ncbi:helix-turn-helix domain-containing protein [Amycolatopsis antarctica]|uniref:helix-turn-helix domain-containing protein n=1 Tax=Amycolatopsis antarctica TaxID=1854586 RepID=UPI001F0ACF0B|nr:helix-turn-helix domain-containing protein [Amycolatopsis antarctica]
MYRELPPPEALRDLVRCLWSGTGSTRTIVPDGCLDLIVGDGRVFVAGPDTAPWRSEIAPGRPIHGIRFRPGNAARVLGVAADELRDRRVRLTDLWGRAGRTATDRLLTDPSALAGIVAGHVRSGPDPAVDRLVGRLRGGASRVGEAMADLDAGDLGVGERQLRRRFTVAVGYGPATYLRIARLERAIGGAAAASGLAELAHGAGYADQAHLSRDFRELTGATPREFLGWR